MTVGIASVIGSFIAAYSMQWTLWLSVVATTASAMAAALLPEYRFHQPFQKGTKWAECVTTLKDGISFCLGRRNITVLIGFSVTVLVTSGILDEYDQLIVRSMGIPFALIGLWGFFRYGVEALGGRTAWKLKRFLNRHGFSEPVSVQFAISSCAGLLLIFAAFFPMLFMLPAYVLYYFLLSAGKVLFTDSLQMEVRHQGRATVQSFAAMLEKPFGIFIYALFGAAGSIGRLQGAMMAVAAWILLFGALFRVLYQT